mmetsp:Transcript_1654/g.4655  ORF Transcript_1654/g.4655 Transcript_1654/m.4655 type:complete len:206 (-) Transcript_1654:946-1563(-)
MVILGGVGDELPTHASCPAVQLAARGGCRASTEEHDIWLLRDRHGQHISGSQAQDDLAKLVCREPGLCGLDGGRHTSHVRRGVRGPPLDVRSSAACRLRTHDSVPRSSNLDTRPKVGERGESVVAACGRDGERARIIVELPGALQLARIARRVYIEQAQVHCGIGGVVESSARGRADRHGDDRIRPAPRLVVGHNPIDAGENVSH